MGELFQQHWREVYIRPDVQSFLFQFVKDSQQVKMRLCCRFMQPFHAMGPGSVVDHIGKMRVQRKCDVTYRAFHLECPDAGPVVPKSEYRERLSSIDAVKRVRNPKFTIKSVSRNVRHQG